MQMVGRVLPTNSYLHRIGKHPNGDCPWCARGTKETMTHFMSQCKQFRTNRTAAHHAIVRAVVAALKEQRPAGWEFHYEKTFHDMPFHFEWATEYEGVQQAARRPDCLAYHPVHKQVIFLEFTRAMDHHHTMPSARDTKSRQYAAAVTALRRGMPGVHVRTAPMVFGVRGSVLYPDALSELRPFALTPAGEKKVLAAGVRAAVTAASDMITARYAALPHVRGRGRGPARRT